MKAFASCLMLLWIMGSAVTAVTADALEARDGELTLSGDNNNFLQSAMILVPILILIIVLDFAIFGTFASRSDELNPISNFFFHARNGLQSIRAKQRRRYHQQYVHRTQRH